METQMMLSCGWTMGGLLCIGLTVGVLQGDLQKFLRQIIVNDEIETTDSVYIHIAGQGNAIFEKMNTMCLFTPVLI